MSFSLEICASVMLQMDSEMNIRFLCVNVEANGDILGIQPSGQYFENFILTYV